MNAMPDKITQVAFGKADNEPLSSNEQDICEEWASGKGEEIMKVSADDPRLLEYLGLYDKLEEKKAAVWESVEAR